MRATQLTLAAALLLSIGAYAAEVKEDFHSVYPLASGGRISIDNRNGSIDISSWDNNTVDIAGTKYARTPDGLRRIKVEFETSPGAITIRTVIPKDSHDSGGVRLVLRVPRRVDLDKIASSNGAIRIRQTTGKLDAETSNGPIDVDAHEGDVKAQTSNGRIRADLLDGNLNAETSNGPIEADMRNPNPSRPVALETSNGPISVALASANLPSVRATTSNAPIELRLPEGANAQVHAATSNSGISSDFDLMMRAGVHSNSNTLLNGTIGSGGPSLDLDTSNGPIRILKAR